MAMRSMLSHSELSLTALFWEGGEDGGLKATRENLDIERETKTTFMHEDGLLIKSEVMQVSWFDEAGL